MYRRIRDYYNDFETAIPRIFRFQLVTKAIVLPVGFLSNRVFKWILAATGIGTITNTNWMSLIFHPAVLPLLLIALILAVFYTVFDVNAMVLLSEDVLVGRRRSTTELIRDAVLDLRLMRSPSGFLLILYLALARPLTGIGVYMTLTKDINPIRMLVRMTEGYPVLLAILLVLYLAVVVLVFLCLYSQHFVLLGKEKPMSGFACSVRLVLHDKWGAVKAYLSVLLGITLPADLLSLILRRLLPTLLWEAEAPLTVCFAISIFGYLVFYTCSILVAPLQILRLTKYYLSRVEPEKMVRPMRDKRTWFFLRIFGFTAIGLFIGYMLSSALPLFDKYLVLNPYKGYIAEDIVYNNSNLAETAEAMYESEENAWHFSILEERGGFELASRTIPVAVEEGRLLFLEISGLAATKKNADELCELVSDCGATDWVFIVMDSSELLRKEMETWPGILMGLRIHENLGNVGLLGADCYVFDSDEVRGSQIADLKKLGAMVCLDIKNPRDYFLKFTLLEEYPDVVITRKTTEFREHYEMLKFLSGSQWVLMLILEL